MARSRCPPDPDSNHLMNKAILIIRCLLGLAFVVFGANYFFDFLKMNRGTPPRLAIDFFTALKSSGYMDVVKVLEITGGVALLTKRFAPLGLLILGPIVVNITLYDIYLGKTFNPIGVAVGVMFVFLLIVYRKNFSGVFAGPRR